MHLGIVKKYLNSERLHEILNDDLDLLCNSLDLDIRAYMFIFLVFCVCSNGTQNDKRLEGSRVREEVGTQSSQAIAQTP
jgi:hypothetical protein